MPYKRPTLPELSQTSENDLASRLNAFGRLRRNVIKVLARVRAGLVHGLYSYIDYLANQLMPWTATGLFLELHAAWWGIRRKPAARATGYAQLFGLPDSKIEAGAYLLADDDRQYQITESGRIDENGLCILAARSVIGGDGMDLAGHAALRLISPITGVKREARAAENGIVGSAEAENDTSLRAWLNDRVQEPPQGGTENDYRQWAKEVPVVTRAWSYGGAFGPGSVGVTFVRDGSDDIIPTDQQVAEVQKYLSDPIRKPITADVIVYAPMAGPVDVVIKALTPDTEKVRTNVTAELAALFVREAVPGGRVLISHIREAISLAAGEYDHVLLSPTENVAPEKNVIPVLGEVHFVETE